LCGHKNPLLIKNKYPFYQCVETECHDFDMFLINDANLIKLYLIKKYNLLLYKIPQIP
jgi:hypothetical protein